MHAQAQKVRSFRQLTPGSLDASRPIVTLFSGGLDSSYLLLRLRDAGFRNVHALSVDLGEDETTEDKQFIAKKLGVDLHIIDGRQTFAREFVGPAIASQAVYLDTHPVSSTLSRPLIARYATELAGELGARTILHTANRSQNTLRRLNGALTLLGFSGQFGSPYELDPVDRSRKIAELGREGITHMSERVVSCDSNLWCREFESGTLDDPENHAVPEDMYLWTKRDAEREAEIVDITFRRGVLVEVNGVSHSLVSLIDELNLRVGAHGIGRYSGLEHLDNGEKVLELREMPAAHLLLRTFRHLESATLQAETIREKMRVEQIWVREALEGRWFGELRTAAQAFVDACSLRVSGTVRWRLHEGSAETRAIRVQDPLYLRNREEWESGLISLDSSYYDYAPTRAGVTRSA
ncbi:argininosuccinate synthase-related protein [Streptomyces werraensis]|uniref:argininosuccinate synthase-related protein n=1 Tax=Streptomyces werraensis TaxID=68284 RepID=UPI0038181F40